MPNHLPPLRTPFAEGVGLRGWRPWCANVLFRGGGFPGTDSPGPRRIATLCRPVSGSPSRIARIGASALSHQPVVNAPPYSGTTPIASAMRTSSERLRACIFSMTRAR